MSTVSAGIVHLSMSTSVSTFCGAPQQECSAYSSFTSPHVVARTEVNEVKTRVNIVSGAFSIQVKFTNHYLW